jgi:hypothetical protein
MAGNRSLLSKVSSKHDSLQVELEDNGRYQVKGTGSISFQLDCKDTLTLGNVLLVPGLKEEFDICIHSRRQRHGNCLYGGKSVDVA